MYTIDNSNFKFDKNIPPALTLPSGSTVKFITKDCFTNQITAENYEDALSGDFNWDQMNPTTGPLSIEGAKPGDVLRVEIQSIALTGEDAVLMTGKGLGACADHFDKLETRVVKVRGGVVEFSPEIQIPIRPMIGVIGVAPQGEPINNGWPGDHGANMDCKEIIEGTTLYLPVFVEGGLLSIGDLHGVMGDGECCGTGAEMPGEVVVKVDLLKDCKLPLPFLETGDRYIAIYSAKTADDAIQGAVRNGVDFLMANYSMSRFDAITLVSLAMDVRICQIVDPLVTSRLEIPKKLVAGFKK
ncbi:MAG: acetamidase/formamidase family protein [Oscillospiraceae bacterium]|nr:acetamidase/formamidase family protein [Oscillospiraceae bacterium]